MSVFQVGHGMPWYIFFKMICDLLKEGSLSFHIILFLGCFIEAWQTLKLGKHNQGEEETEILLGTAKKWNLIDNGLQIYVYPPSPLPSHMPF